MLAPLVTLPPSVAVAAVIEAAVGVVTVGGTAWVTVICWPSTVRCAVRAAPVVLAVKEKLTTPLAPVPIVSQDWSLLGAKIPVSDAVVGSTGKSALDPEAGPGTNARGNS